eukprot:1950492-Pyramimonas_sp.AAC.1
MRLSREPSLSLSESRAMLDKLSESRPTAARGSRRAPRGQDHPTEAVHRGGSGPPERLCRGLL